MKNICFIDYDAYVMGGVEKVMQGLANSLCESYNVHILSIQKSNENVFYSFDDRIKIFYFNQGCVRLRKAIIGTSFLLKEYIKRNKIDVVVMLGHYVPIITVMSKILTKAKFIFCDHLSLMAQINEKDHVFLRKVGNKFSDKVITLTQRNMEDYKSLLKTPSSKIDYIYNWINDEYIKSVENNIYDINSKKIITAGRFTEQKGYDMLVDVAKIVFDKHPDWQWDLYGDGEDFEEVKNKIFKLNLQDNLILKGKSSNINDLYKNYSMYVLTSYREGLPLVLLEAKANRLPIVSFDCTTGPREIVEDGTNGFLIDCYDKNKMANKICELIEDSDLREKFSKNAYNNIDEFSKDKILKKWKTLIDNI